MGITVNTSLQSSTIQPYDEKMPMTSPTLTDDGYYSEEESVLYKDHRRGTVEQYVEKNTYKSRAYRNFAQVANPALYSKIKAKRKKKDRKKKAKEEEKMDEQKKKKKEE